MDFANALHSITAAIGLAKAVRDVDRAVDDTLFKSQIVELQTALADAKRALIEAEDEVRKKNKEIENLMKSFEFQGALVESQGWKYEQKDGEPVGLPFCPRCETMDGVFVRITIVRSPKGTRDKICPQCKSSFFQASDRGYPDR